MIIYLHSNSVPLHFVQNEYIIRCIIASLPKLISPNQIWRPPWWYFKSENGHTHKPMSIILESHVWSTMQIWSEKLMWWNLLAMNHLQFMVNQRSNDILFMLLFGWKFCPILLILNISKALCITNLTSPN